MERVTELAPRFLFYLLTILFRNTIVMDKKKLYCRYCGKLIDEDATVCTYCGKKQNKCTPLSSIWNTLSCFLQNIYYKIPQIKLKSDRTILNSVKKMKKRILILILILIAVWSIVLPISWLYGSHLVSKWTKEDERREAIALKDITKADSIARVLFKESAQNAHLYNKLCKEKCNFNHIENGIDILQNAAEKGDADAQFSLGIIYGGRQRIFPDNEYRDIKGALLDDDIYWSTLDGKYAGMYYDPLRRYGNNPKRAAYWYSLAAKQGHKQALFNLGIAYRNGNGVERNLVKATESIKISAEQGESFAQLIYGDMFRDGEVCIAVTDSIKGKVFILNAKPNIRLAKEWWTKALKNGNEKARERLEQVYE